MPTYYSTDDEHFHYRDIEGVFDALESEVRFKEGVEYFEAEFRPMMVYDVIDADDILSTMHDRLCEELGDYYEHLSVTPEAKDELNTLLCTWVNEHASLSDYLTISGKSRVKVVTQEDVRNRYGNV